MAADKCLHVGSAIKKYFLHVEIIGTQERGHSNCDEASHASANSWSCQSRIFSPYFCRFNCSCYMEQRLIM